MSFIADQLASNPPPEWARRPEVLLDAPLPVPMHGMAPRVALGQKWWDAERAAAFATTGGACVACGGVAHSGHERYETDWLLGRMAYVETVPLCKKCHAFCHQGWMRAQVESGQMLQAEFEAIIRHGFALTKTLGKKREMGVTTVEWGEWRLVVNGQEFPPLYESFEAYKKHFGIK
jgi:hypothetical protein